MCRLHIVFAKIVNSKKLFEKLIHSSYNALSHISIRTRIKITAAVICRPKRSEETSI